MEHMIAAFLGGSAASALISGVFALIQGRLQRGKRRSETEQALVDGMKFILLDVIAQRALRYLQAGEAELRDKQLLRSMPGLPHRAGRQRRPGRPDGAGGPAAGAPGGLVHRRKGRNLR